jgi:hypothetical protein
MIGVRKSFISQKFNQTICKGQGVAALFPGWKYAGASKIKYIGPSATINLVSAVESRLHSRCWTFEDIPSNLHYVNETRGRDSRQ